MENEVRQPQTEHREQIISYTVGMSLFLCDTENIGAYFSTVFQSFRLHRRIKALNTTFLLFSAGLLNRRKQPSI